MIKKIIVATDGSEVSGKAVAYAGDLAATMGASISLVGVVDSHYLFTLAVPPAVSPTEIRESTEDLLRQTVDAYLDEAAADLQKRGVTVSKIVRTGHPVEEIVQAAQSEKADLIVLGSHGRSALRAAVLGSVAYGVLHKDLHIPVLVVKR